MVNISKQRLKKETRAKLFNQLSKLVTRASSKSSTVFLEELLSETEHIMIAKRLAVILLIRTDMPKKTIARVLLMSKTTVSKIDEKYQNGGYKTLTKVLGKSKKEREQVLNTLERILRAGMPSQGKDRWGWLDGHFAQPSRKR